MLEIDLSGILNCNTYLVVPSYSQWQIEKFAIPLNTLKPIFDDSFQNFTEARNWGGMSAGVHGGHGPERDEDRQAGHGGLRFDRQTGSGWPGDDVICRIRVPPSAAGRHGQRGSFETFLVSCQTW